MKLSQRAFTLIELMVVVAVTAVMLGLLIIPVVQSFNFTRAAQGLAEGQERARRVIEGVTKDIALSASVRDNEGARGQVAIVVPDLNGINVSVLADFAKLYIQKPLEGDPTLRDPSGAYIDPRTGIADPTRQSSVGQPVFPAAPGSTVVVYYVCLNRPLAANNLDPEFYYNPYIDYKRAGGVLWNQGIGPDNLYVLRRAEVAPKVWLGGNYVVNTRFFDDANGDNEPDYDDPYFMAQDAPGGPILTAPQRIAKAARMANWLRVSRIVTDFSRFDMIQPVFNRRTRQIETVLGTVPRISTLIQFKPSTVSNEAAEGATALRLGNESEGMDKVASDVLRTKDGAWSSAVIRIHPTNFDPANPAVNDYFVCRLDDQAGARKSRIYSYDPDLDPDLDDRNGEGNPIDDMEVFDIGTYERWINLGFSYPFTRAMQDSNSRSGWLANAVLRSKFVPFFAHLRDGKITASFKIEDWGIDNPGGGIPPAGGNLPFLLTGPELTPTTDPTPAGNFFDAAYASNINRHFNKVYFDNPLLRVPNGVHRFIDLRTTLSADGAVSPLNPDPAVGFQRGRIVPGSEIIVGPDQNSGPNYGNPVKYTRVTRNPGRNQYVINYTDLAEPNYVALGYALPPAVYTPTNFVSAIIQARYKTGYVQFNSDPALPLPTLNPVGGSPISISYRFQLNAPSDSVTVDYDTRSLMEILLTIRNHPQSSLSSTAMITVKGTAPVRNLVR